MTLTIKEEVQKLSYDQCISRLLQVDDLLDDFQFTKPKDHELKKHEDLKTEQIHLKRRIVFIEAHVSKPLAWASIVDEE